MKCYKSFVYTFLLEESCTATSRVAIEKMINDVMEMESWYQSKPDFLAEKLQNITMTIWKRQTGPITLQKIVRLLIAGRQETIQVGAQKTM